MNTETKAAINMLWIDKRFILLLTLIIVGSVWYFTSYLKDDCPSCPATVVTTTSTNTSDTSISPDNYPPMAPATHPTTFQYRGDVIRAYDEEKIHDVLEQPTRRIPRHEIPNMVVRRGIDYPTRGYPDNFSQQGILVAVDKKDSYKDKDKKCNGNCKGKHKDDDKDTPVSQPINYDNRIIRLFGRQQYPGSNRYDYYTSISSGNDQIKIPIGKKNKELYDGDEIYINELGSRYRVQLHDFDEPKYYPDII